MKLETLELSPGEESRAWELFPKSPMQRILHNLQVREILSLRDKLETAAPSDFPAIQAEIKAARKFLGLIHRKDELPTK